MSCACRDVSDVCAADLGVKAVCAASEGPTSTGEVLMSSCLSGILIDSQARMNFASHITWQRMHDNGVCHALTPFVCNCCHVRHETNVVRKDTCDQSRLVRRFPHLSRHHCHTLLLRACFDHAGIDTQIYALRGHHRCPCVCFVGAVIFLWSAIMRKMNDIMRRISYL